MKTATIACLFMSLAVLVVPPLAADAARKADPTETLHLANTWSIPMLAYRIDHMAMDTKRKHLIIAGLGDRHVIVVDMKDGSLARDLPGMNHPQDVLYLPDLDMVAISLATDGALRFYNAETWQLIRTIDSKPEADNLRYDPATKRIYLAYAESLEAFDAQTGQSKGVVKLGIRPEGFELESSSSRLFANLDKPPRVAVIDREKMTVIDTWPLEHWLGNYAMAHDEANHRLFIACRRPARLVVLNTSNGQVVGDYPLMNECDGLFYDGANKRIYASCGAGTIDVYHQDDPDHYTLASRIPTAIGARTSVFVPQTNQFIVALGKTGAEPAEVRVFDVIAQPETSPQGH